MGQDVRLGDQDVLHVLGVLVGLLPGEHRTGHHSTGPQKVRQVLQLKHDADGALTQELGSLSLGRTF